MFELGAEIIICLILAALIGGIIGYVLGKGSCQKSSTCQENLDTTHELHINKQGDSENTVVQELTADAKSTVVEEVNLGIKPTSLLTEARDEEKDNLQLIKGVGKVLEKVLNETGIYHFSQIANLTKDEVQWLNASIAFPGRIEREKWVQQAEELAKRKSR